MKNKKHIVIIVIVAVVAATVFFVSSKYNFSKNEISKRINEASIVKMEYYATSNYVEMVNIALINTFDVNDENIVRSDIPVDKWIYKTTYDSKELNSGNKEYIVEFGENSFSVNGVTYCLKNKRDYVNWLIRIGYRYERVGFEIEKSE